VPVLVPACSSSKPVFVRCFVFAYEISNARQKNERGGNKRVRDVHSVVALPKGEMPRDRWCVVLSWAYLLENIEKHRVGVGGGIYITTIEWS